MGSYCILITINNAGVHLQIPAASSHQTDVKDLSSINKLLVSPAVLQYVQKANYADLSCKSWLLKRVESQSCCAADFTLLHGDCNPGDASANGRKPEPDTGIKVGVADRWKSSASTCQAILTTINYMFTAGQHLSVLANISSDVSSSLSYLISPQQTVLKGWEIEVAHCCKHDLHHKHLHIYRPFYGVEFKIWKWFVFPIEFYLM